MSAIGSYSIMSRTDFEECLDLASRVHTETTGK
jgi:hypothetical protein